MLDLAVLSCNTSLTRGTLVRLVLLPNHPRRYSLTPSWGKMSTPGLKNNPWGSHSNCFRQMDKPALPGEAVLTWGCLSLGWEAEKENCKI